MTVVADATDLFGGRAEPGWGVGEVGTRTPSRRLPLAGPKVGQVSTGAGHHPRWILFLHDQGLRHIGCIDAYSIRPTSAPADSDGGQRGLTYWAYWPSPDMLGHRVGPNRSERRAAGRGSGPARGCAPLVRAVALESWLPRQKVQPRTVLTAPEGGERRRVFLHSNHPGWFRMSWYSWFTWSHPNSWWNDPQSSTSAVRGSGRPCAYHPRSASTRSTPGRW